MSVMTLFKNGNANYSFSRVAAFVTILVSQILAIIAMLKGVKQDAVDWVGMGAYVKNLFGGTGLMVFALYGSNKGAEVLKAFAEARKK